MSDEEIDEFDLFPLFNCHKIKKRIDKEMAEENIDYDFVDFLIDTIREDIRNVFYRRKK